jgi:hypothetical protein
MMVRAGAWPGSRQARGDFKVRLRPPGTPYQKLSPAQPCFKMTSFPRQNWGSPPRTDVTNDPNICTRCIGAKRFAKWIGLHGVVGPCGIESAHGRRHKVVPVSKLAEAVDAWFRETFTLGTQDPHITDDSDNVSYEQRGEPCRYLLMSELECSVRAIGVIAEHLPDVSQHDIKQGAERFYDDGQNYEAVEAITRRQHEEWEEHWYEVRFRLQWQEFAITFSTIGAFSS